VQLAILPAVTRPERFRLRAPASGREAVVSFDGALPDTEGGEVGYYDRVTGERMEVVGKLVPTASSPSNLPRAPENLRICPHCEELVGRDLSDCPYCGRRMPPVGRPS
jgi:hypothetical protein